MTVIDNQLDLLDLIASFAREPIDAVLTPDQIFEADEISLFVRLGEDARYDRKSSRIQPAGLSPVVCAFSNGPSISGGIIAVGISNDGTLEGCKRLGNNRLLSLESAALTFCPLANVRSRKVVFTTSDMEEDFILLFYVRYVPNRLIETSAGDAYQRIADKSVRLNDVAKHQLRIDKGERSFEQEAANLSYPGDFDINHIRKFCRRVKEQRQSVENHSDEAVLDALRLGRQLNGTFIPNHACALLFAKDPLRIFPEAYVRFLRFEGVEEKSGKEYNVVKDRSIEGTVHAVIRDTASIIDASIREFTEFREGRFYSVYEYPRDAWFELLVNACVHRSYLHKNVPIFVKMFDDRLVFESPGGFMPGVTPDNIYDRHHPRNPFVMAVLKETGEVKCINEGTKRVRKEMASAKLPAPVFFEKQGDNSSVNATLKNNIANRSNTLDSVAYQALGEVVALSLTPQERKIINYIMANERITATDAIRIAATTRWHTAKRLLDSLVSRGILHFHSSKLRDPNSFYELAKDAERGKTS